MYIVSRDFKKLLLARIGFEKRAQLVEMGFSGRTCSFHEKTKTKKGVVLTYTYEVSFYLKKKCNIDFFFKSKSIKINNLNQTDK